jgi:formate-dependent phosphoribosylglycinamide formyltransferase (GAR transformylase)
MNVLMISPGFPKEMQYFTRGLASVGARVIGIGDQSEGALPDEARRHLSAYFPVPSLTDEAAIIGRARNLAERIGIDRVECLWEPYLVLAARIREALGLPGMTVEQTLPFRDKELMKQVLDRAGIRTPYHHRATTVEQVIEAADDIGYPVIVKPIAGAGSEHTYRVGSREELDEIAPRMTGIREVSVEEFIEGEDMTFDTICVDGVIQHFNLSTYRPRALFMKENEWVSPITITINDVEHPALRLGREMGEAVLRALGFQTGYTHMEWYLTSEGEAVFGEIGARSPGAHLVDLINFASDADTYTGWAEAVVHGRYTQPVEHVYSAAWIFKRARGEGRIQRYDGLEPLMAEYGAHVCVLDLNPIGAPRRDWRRVLIGDGMVITRHRDFQVNLEMARQFAARLEIVAG